MGPSPISVETATAAEALAKAYRDIGHFDKALEYYHEALAARALWLGSTNPAYLKALDSIAVVYEQQSKWQEALSFYQTSLAGRQLNAALGENHPSTLTVATNVARMHQNRDQNDEALRQYSDILSKYNTRSNGN